MRAAIVRTGVMVPFDRVRIGQMFVHDQQFWIRVSWKMCLKIGSPNVVCLSAGVVELAQGEVLPTLTPETVPDVARAAGFELGPFGWRIPLGRKLEDLLKSFADLGFTRVLK